MTTDKSGWVLGRVLADQAASRGDAPFMQFRDGEPLTFAQADATANRVANGLAHLGVGQGDHVAVMLRNGLDYFHCWAGISRAGAVHVAINTAYKGGFLAHVLSNSASGVIITEPEYLSRLAEIVDDLPALTTAIVTGGAQEPHPTLGRLRMVAFKTLMDSPPDPPGVEVSYRDLGMIMYTSGTTGPSKGVLMPHAHVYLFGLGAVENLRLVPQDIFYICMPLYHANALLIQLYGCLIAGAKAVVVPGFSASGWLDDIRRYGATITATLGVMTEFVFRQPPRPEDGDHALRLVFAVPNPPEIAGPFCERFKVPLLEGYGMTEVNMPLYMPMDAPYRPGSCGKPYEKFFQVAIVHPETDEPMPPQAMGEIVVRPKEPYAFMQGYNAMPQKTVETWRNFWFHTGDAGRQDEDGYIYFVDRIKDCIRVRGENISSYEIESVLGDHPAVAEAAAIAVKSEIVGGEDEIKASIVLKPDATLTPEALLDFCSPRMPHFAVPRYVDFVESLPKTPTQKVQKGKLRDAGITPSTWDREAAGYKVAR